MAVELKSLVPGRGTCRTTRRDVKKCWFVGLGSDPAFKSCRPNLGHMDGGECISFGLADEKMVEREREREELVRVKR